MQTPRPGRPPKSAADLARRTPDMARWSQEAPDALLRKIDAEASKNERSRNAEVRVLLGEAIEARRVKKAADAAEKKETEGA